MAGESEIIKVIKESYKKSNKPNHNIKFPSGIICTISGKDVELKLTPDSVISNMQTDASAFEGWALVIKRWTDYEKVILKWKKPTDKDNQHYQRFLFRVAHFVELFPVWFEIHDDCKDYIIDSRIIQGRTYYVNVPSVNRLKPDHNDLKGESKLEAQFLQDPTLKIITNAHSIDHQLPVGVFSGYPLSTKNQIFTGKKSAIDLWGITLDDKLIIFELKDEKNKSVGIISELLFYCHIMRLIQDRNFQYPPTALNIYPLCVSKGISAYFLTPELHPLIDYNLVKILNEACQPDVEFHYIQFEGSPPKDIHQEF